MGDSLDCPNLFGIRIGCDVSRTKTRTNLGMVSELSLILVNNGVRSVTAGKDLHREDETLQLRLDITCEKCPSW